MDGYGGGVGIGVCVEAGAWGGGGGGCMMERLSVMGNWTCEVQLPLEKN